MKQIELIPKNSLSEIKGRSFGGISKKKRRKVERPLRAGLIHHVVFKSSRAHGKLSFYTHKALVAQLLKERSRKNFVEILDWVNMGNHLHLKVRFKDKARFQSFLKTFAGLLARKITNSHRGTSFGRFWDGLVYTRILTSKLEILSLRGYFEGNHRERELGPQERRDFLLRWNQWIYRLKKVRARSSECS
jgi:REP element-mobilizing transposase RayT